MKDGEREVHEFTGMWPLKPDADLVKFTKTLAFRYFWNLMDGEVIHRGRQLCPELCAILDINFRQTAISSPPTSREFSKGATLC
jgi:hypothetical protein